MGRLLSLPVVVTILVAAISAAEAARLEPKSPSTAADLVAKSHDVRVVINNGFAMTEVRHTFKNRGGKDLEATYAFPLPKSASLSELSITSGEREIHGEVLPRKKAQEIYEEVRDSGGDSALATKNGYQDFRFAVSAVRAGKETTIRFVYYQPLEIDTGIGRYLYPLEDGGTDEGASFWKPEVVVEGEFSFSLELKSAWPVADVRLPGHDRDATVENPGEGQYLVKLVQPQAVLNRDIVFYYRLKDDLPGRVEFIPYRESGEGPGTFMMVLTPGLDLKPITGGADYSFILDVSGSMAGKIGILSRGVVKALGKLEDRDRFRIVAFNDIAWYVTGGFVPATTENVKQAASKVESLDAGGSTSLYEGLALGLTGLDADRAQSVILVTDAVTNTGELRPAEFHKLMKKVDVRAFGFLLGNGANWPLMEAICDASGGFWAQVSNADDIYGKILLAESKITHECLHDAKLSIRGVKVSDTTDLAIGKVFRGQQLVFFGKYASAGKATVTLSAKLTGEDKVYRTEFEFPETDTENPELERLWAMHRVEAIEASEFLGKAQESEVAQAVRDLGVAYQIVTDETSMVVLSDEVFTSRGIERQNVARVAKESKARAQRASAPVRNRRVDGDRPMFKRKAPGIGGGALDPISVGLLLSLAGIGLAARRRRKR